MRKHCLKLLALSLVIGCSKSDSGPMPVNHLPPDMAQKMMESAMAEGRQQQGGPSDAAPAASSGAPVRDGSVELNGQNTMIGFKGTKPDGTVHLGGFRELAGAIGVDPASGAIKQLHVEIQTESLWADVDRLTTHLKSPDFFNVRENPTLTFTSTAVQDGTVTGELTMLGTTHETTLPLKVQMEEGKLTLEGQFTIDRTQWGMNYGEGQVDKEVTITVSVGKAPAAEATGAQGTGANPGVPAAAAGGRFGGGGGGGFDPAAMFQQRDTNKDGKLSADEMSERMRGRLSELDTDGDNAVSLEEMMAGFSRRGAGGPGPGAAGAGAAGNNGAERPVRPAGE